MKKRLSLPILLLAIAALAAVPYVRVAVARFVGYDGFWHVFMAAQDRLRTFLSELAGDAHPPLFYGLLRIALAFGRSRLVYRSIPLLSTFASIVLVGRLARDLGAERPVAALAAFTFAFSIAALIMANEVRSYMVAIAFALLSIDFLVRALRSRGRGGLLLPVAAASASAALALLSDYSAVFVLSAGLAIAVLFVSRDRALRARILESGAAGRIAACLLAAPLPAAVFFLRARQRQFARPIGFLSRFYFLPGGGESLPAFLLRTARSEAALFSPLSGLRGGEGITAALLSLVVGGAMLAARGRRRRRLAAFPALVLAVAAAETAVAAVVGVYPFGGALRQQFGLFPFAVLASALAVQGVASRFRSRKVRAAVIAIPAFGVAVSFGLAVGPYLKPTGEPIARSDVVFRRIFSGPPLVYADQFSVIALFAGRDRWKWTSQGTVTGAPGTVVYRVSRDGESFRLVRDAERWNVDFDQPRFYELLRSCLRVFSSKSIVVFEVVDRTGPIDAEGAAGIRRSIRLGASAAGLSPGRIAIRGRNVFVELAEAR